LRAKENWKPRGKKRELEAKRGKPKKREAKEAGSKR